MKLNIALIEPEIPQNTGNIVRTAVATGAAVHLVKPLGFDVSDKNLKRAGLDYWNDAEIHYHNSFGTFFESIQEKPFYLLSTKGKKIYSKARFEEGAYIIFGKETKGLPESLLSDYYDHTLRIPMVGSTRSLNLSNSVAIIVYEALRQHNFSDMVTKGNLSDHSINKL